MARAHQYILNYRVFRRHLAELAGRFSEAERDKAEFALSFAGDISKVVDYLIADAEAIAAFETDQIVLVDLTEPVLARRLIESARAHELFHRLGDQGFDEMLGLIDVEREDASVDEWVGVLTQCAAMAGSQIGVCALLRSELPLAPEEERPAPKSDRIAAPVELTPLVVEVISESFVSEASEDQAADEASALIAAEIVDEEEDEAALEIADAMAVAQSLSLAAELPADAADGDDGAAILAPAPAPDAAAEPEKPASGDDASLERPRELVLWNVGAGSAQLFVEVAYKLIQERLPDLAGYFELLKRLSTGERTRRSAIEQLAEAEHVRNLGARWRVFWF